MLKKQISEDRISNLPMLAFVFSSFNFLKLISNILGHTLRTPYYLIERVMCCNTLLFFNKSQFQFQQPKASSVPPKKFSSRQQPSSGELPIHPDHQPQRRLSLSETYTVRTFEEHSRFPILPPLTKSKETSNGEVDQRTKDILEGINKRTLGKLIQFMCNRQN